MLIHFVYASLTKKARAWLASEKGGRSVNRIGCSTFMLFDVNLAKVNIIICLQNYISIDANLMCTASSAWSPTNAAV
jgi:hypothetical protein